MSGAEAVALEAHASAAAERTPAEPNAGEPRPVVIFNPGAGGGSPDDAAARRKELRHALADAAFEAELFESSSEADTERRVDEAIEAACPIVVAAGGDGTVRSVAFRLLGAGRPADQLPALGILPMGTAMNVARSLGIPLELGPAAQVLATGTPRPIDVGEVRGQPFLEVASIGLGAELLAGATHAGEGRIREALHAAATAFRYPRTRVRLQLDGREIRGRSPSLAVANGAFTGRGLELAPGASLDDGRFDVLVYVGYGIGEMIVHLARLVLGRTHEVPIRRYRAARVVISARRTLPVRADSQDLGTTPVELVTRPAALRVIAPSSA